MSFGLFKNILLVNFKKNWMMVCSFFVFLVISCAILFGLTSFIIGMRQQIPYESFQENKSSILFDARSIKSANSRNTNTNNLTLNEKAEDDLFTNGFIPSVKAAGISDESFLAKNTFENIIDELGGSLDAKPNNNQLPSDLASQKDNLKTLQDYIYSNSHTYNLMIYMLSTYALPKNKLDINVNNQLVKPNIWNYHEQFISNEQSLNQTDILMYSQANNLMSPKTSGYFTDHKYENSENVVYASSTTANNKHYKLGQKITLTRADNTYQSFTYGGVYVSDTKKIYTDKSTTDRYFIMNYKPSEKCDFNSDISGLQENLFIWYPKMYSNMSDRSAEEKVLGNVFKYNTGYSHIIRFDSYQKFYNAFFLINILLIVILLVLNIVLAWFLIRVMIDSMSKQILFLKALGLEDGEASLINTCNILVILVVGVGIGIAASLGIQAAFGNMITNFLEIFIKWNVIQPLTAILIVGLPVFLCIVYFVLNFALLRKMKVRQSSVVRKSEFAFRRTREYFFNRNINLGITFAFNVKNSIKMVVAFVIVLLMTTLTFLCGQFVTSISQGNNAKNKFNNYMDNYSYNMSYEMHDDGDNKYLKQNIVYKNVDDAKEITNPMQLLTAPLANSYITRKTIDKYVDIHSTQTAKLKDLENRYDNLINDMWPGTDSNFRINFGSMYKEENTDVRRQFSYLFNPGWDLRTVVVLADNSYQVKQMFKGNTESYKKDHYLPLAMSNNLLGSGDIKKNEIINDGHIDAFSKPLKIKAKVSVATTCYADSTEIFVRQSDFNDAIRDAITKQYPNDINFLNEVNNTVLNNDDYFNSFMSKGMPLELRQFVARGDFSKTISNPTELGKDIASALDYNNIHVIYLSQIINELTKTVKPLSNVFMVLIILALILMLVFIIFMVYAIMDENDEIIFIMKALGYSSTSILRRIITGYLASMLISIVLGLLISWGLLSVLNGAFASLIFTSILFYWTWPIIVLIIAFVVVLSGITLGISSLKIHLRSLTIREE